MVGNRLDRDAYETILVLAAGGPRSARYVLQQQATFKLACLSRLNRQMSVTMTATSRRGCQLRGTIDDCIRLRANCSNSTTPMALASQACPTTCQQPLRADLIHIIHPSERPPSCVICTAMSRYVAPHDCRVNF